VGVRVFLRGLWALEWRVAKFFFSQSIGIDHNNKKIVDVTGFCKIVGATGLGDSWALRWAWQLVGVKVGVANFFLDIQF